MTETTDNQIAEMKRFAESFKQAHPTRVKDAYIDDWGRHGNFSLRIQPVTKDRHTTTRLKKLVRDALPAGSHLRQVFPPDKYIDRITGKPKYDSSYWNADVDYQRYDAASNTFAKA